MTATDDNLNSILEQIDHYVVDLRDTDIQETLLNDKLAQIRLELAQLKDKRYQTKTKLRKAAVEKESVERKIHLQQEAAAIQESIEKKKAEAEELLKNVPWKDVAKEWQIAGALQLPERALLGDKRGLGKTLSSLIWLRMQKANKVLVCLRKEVAEDFIKEIGIREPNKFVYPLIGANSDSRKIAAMLLNGHKEFIVVTNIESWRKNVIGTTEDLLRIDYDAVILDEAHHIKNAGTGTAQGFFVLADAVPKVLELTGTPIKNKPQEMYSLLHALYPQLFPTERKFQQDFCVQITQNKWVFTPQGLVRLVELIKPFYLARSPEDIGRDVPPPRMIEYKLDFENHLQQKEAYRAMTERSMAVLNSGKVIPIVHQLAIMTRQAQMVSWPAGIQFYDKESGEVIRFDVEQSVKMDWAEELIQELVGEGERILLFSRFKPAIYELRNRLQEAGLSVAVITGEENKGNNKEIFNDFDLKTASKDNYKFQVLLATYQTVGESANLNAARHVILYDRFWNPGNEDQAIGRIDRLNSTDQATVHVPLVDKSIDIYMTDLIEEKRNIVSGFKDASDMQTSLKAHLEKTL